MAKRKVQPTPGDGTYGNGSIVQRGNRWRIRWRENGERMSESGFKSAAEARDRLTTIQNRLGAGLPGSEPEAPKPVETRSHDQAASFGDLLEDFIAYRVAHRRRMAAEDRTRWDRHLAGPLQTQTVAGLTSAFVRELAQELVNPTPGTKDPDGKPKPAVSGPTATRVLALLSAFYRWAIRQGLAETNPVRSVLTDPDIKSMLASTHDKSRRRTLKSWADVDRLYGAMARTSTGIAFYLGARAGLRPGEAYALRWGNVDVDGKVIRVSRSVRLSKEGTTKSGKPRPVPMSPKLAAELTAWRALVPHGDTDLVCPPPARTKRDGSKGEAMGTYLGKRSVASTLKIAFKATGIRPAEMYAIGRHTFGTLVGLSAAVSAPRLQAIMGHANIATTLRYINQADQPLSEKELAAFG